jgi:hypothetical protein
VRHSSSQLELTPYADFRDDVIDPVRPWDSPCIVSTGGLGVRSACRTKYVSRKNTPPDAALTDQNEK